MTIRKKWILKTQPDRDAVKDISKKRGISLLLSSVLCARGIDTEEKIDAFLNVSKQKLGDPMTMKDMDKAIDIITKAIEEKKRIAVYGDYDVDGITAVCVIIKYLKSAGADCDYYIPDRITEGYGLNIEAIDSLKAQGVELIITVDTGVTAIEETEYCKNAGIEIVITDHHECKEILPNAGAVINPKQPGCNYEFKELAGVGVAFALVRALDIYYGKNRTVLDDEYITLVAMGTIADVMMLTGENRLITDIGMRKLAMTSNVGLRALMRHCTADGREKRGISTSTVSFMLAPRINAAGRLGKAELAARLFLTGDANEADMLAEKLCEMNRERQAMENDIYEEAVAELEESFDTKRDKVIVLWHEDWHHGVIGIVASRLADKYFVPSILISLDEDEGKGSGRSIQGFNLFEALSQCGSLLTKYGGHELAAGLTVPKSNLLELRKALSEYTREFISDDCVPIIEADCEVDPALLTLEAVEELSKLEPYGMGNPQPVLVIKEAKILSMIPIGNDRHTRLTLECQGLTYDSVLFGVCSDDLPMVEDDIVDIIFTPDINNFRGKSVQLILKDIQRCESDLRQDERDDELYDRFTRNENLTSAEAARIRPVRKELVAVWRGVNRHASEGMLKTDITKLQGKLRQESGTELNRAKLLIALDVFSELGLFVHEVTDNILIVYTRKVSRKADISTSMILRRLKAFE